MLGNREKAQVRIAIVVSGSLGRGFIVSDCGRRNPL